MVIKVNGHILIKEYLLLEKVHGISAMVFLRLNFSLVARCSLLFADPRYFLIVYWLHFARCSLRFACYFFIYCMHNIT